ncbi:hypothetical protein [Bacillus smithii]|uniref:hypothetical protein n=1 Tax=Bacillus smithii TaxID=1479 RepID=UPI003D21E817
MNIIMRNPILEVTEVKKKTKAKMFKNLKVGSKIMLSIPVKYAGKNSRGTYASDIGVENIETGEVTYKSFNETVPLLDLFEFEYVTGNYEIQ